MNDKPAPERVGILAHPAVKWLVQDCEQLRRHLFMFLEDHAAPVVTYIGPSDEQEVGRALVAGRMPNLPSVVFGLAKVKHRLNGETGVRVTCSDRDLLVVIGWWRSATSGKIARAAEAAPNTGASHGG